MTISIEQIHQIKEIIRKYKNFECVECAQDIQDYLTSQGVTGKRIKLYIRSAIASIIQLRQLAIAPHPSASIPHHL